MAEDVHSLLNPEQRSAVAHGGGPLMVLAGAGSGKTRVLVHRITRLVAEERIPPWEVLAVTFTNKAAGEMRERLRGMLGEPRARAMWIGTFHATCARLLRRHGEAIGLSRDFSIFDDDDQRRLITGLLKELGLSEQTNARSVMWRIDRAKNRGADPAQIEPLSVADDIARRVYPLYRDRLAREDAVDFNDLLLKVLDLAVHAEVGPALAGQFRHVLVDEFQDTNLIQYRLVRHFTKQTRNLTVVGDDDQSIYSWRGAEPRNLLDFDRDFPDAAVVKLEQNYRSTAMILDSANAIIEKNADRHVKRLWTDRGDGDPVHWEELPDDRSEAQYVARRIQLMVEDEGLDPGDFAILYRTHAQSRSIEEALRAHGIEYKVVGGTSFFQRKEIKDVRAYLKLLINPAADSCFERIINVPSRGIGKTTVERIKTHARIAGISCLDATRSCSLGAVQSVGAAARKKLAAFVELIDALRELHASGQVVSELIVQAVERSGYRERLEIEDTPEAADRLDNLGQLVAMAADFERETEGKGTLADFEERISLTGTNDAADGRGASVTMMTIHAAKGLEFPIVFLCGLEEGLFPLAARDLEVDERESLEEERRLAYVAITRAEDRLILTSARTRRVWNEVRICHPSRFLDDLPARCVTVRARHAGPPRQRRPDTSRRRQAPRHDEFDQRTPYDELPELDVDDFEPMDELGEGSTVRHTSFGLGRVLQSRGEGHDRKLLIQFSTVGLKTILARFVEPTGD